MAHYRKVETFIWNDQHFNQLSRDAKLLFLCVLTHPNLTVLGAMRASARGLGEELQFSNDELEMALDELLSKKMLRYEQGSLFIWLPHFLKYNPPESPNMVKSWESALSYLPECVLKNALIDEAAKLAAQLGKSFQDALPESMRQRECTFGSVLKSERRHASLVLSGEEVSVPLPPTPTPTLSVTPTEGVTLTPPVTPTEGVTLTPPVTPTQRVTPTPTVSTEHRALNIKHRSLSIKQETEEIVLLANSEEKTEIGEITTIVAPARQKTARSPDAEVVEVFRCWQRTLGHPQAQLDVKRRKIIRRALSSGYNFAQLSEAIKGCAQTPHNMGENEQGQRYDGLHIIFRDADQIDRFIRNAHSPPRRRTVEDQLFADNLAASDRWVAKKQQQAEKEIHAIN